MIKYLICFKNNASGKESIYNQCSLYDRKSIEPSLLLLSSDAWVSKTKCCVGAGATFHSSLRCHRLVRQLTFQNWLNNQPEAVALAARNIGLHN